MCELYANLNYKHFDTHMPHKEYRTPRPFVKLFIVFESQICIYYVFVKK